MWGENGDRSFFNPNINFTSKQLAPYTISGGFDGDLNVNIAKEPNESNIWGGSMGLQLSPDKLTLSPTLSYKIAEHVRLVYNMQVDSDFTCKLAVGAEYDFSQETKVAVQFTESLENFSELKETVVLVQLSHQGYAFKCPIYGYTDEGNNRGKVVTFGLFALANYVTYKILKYQKDK